MSSSVDAEFDPFPFPLPHPARRPRVRRGRARRERARVSEFERGIDTKCSGEDIDWAKTPGE
jgi:hypothetical protein